MVSRAGLEPETRGDITRIPIFLGVKILSQIPFQSMTFENCFFCYTNKQYIDRFSYLCI